MKLTVKHFPKFEAVVHHLRIEGNIDQAIIIRVAEQCPCQDSAELHCFSRVFSKVVCIRCGGIFHHYEPHRIARAYTYSGRQLHPKTFCKLF